MSPTPDDVLDGSPRLAEVAGAAREAARDALRRASGERLSFRRELAAVRSQGSEALLAAIEGLETVEFTAGALLRGVPEAAAETLRLASQGVREQLERSGIAFDGEVGEPVDLARHRVVRTEVAPAGNSGRVLKVLRQGVVFRGKRLRPAAVVAGVTEEEA